MKKLLGVKAVELRILRVRKVNDNGIVFFHGLLYKEASVTNMDINQGTGKAFANQLVQVQYGRIELDVVYVLWSVFDNFLNGPKDPSCNQQDSGPLFNLTEGKVDHRLYIKVARGK